MTGLDQAILSMQQIVASLPPGAPGRAAWLTSLCICLSTRFERSPEPDPADLDAAIEAGREASGTAGADDPNRPAMLANLGNSLRIRYELAGQAADLEEAIDAGREALGSAPEDLPGRAAILSGLAAVLRHRYQRTGDQADLEEADKAAREAELAARDGPS